MNVNWKGVRPIQGPVIVVEDDPLLRTLVQEIMSEVAAETLAFETADDALVFLLQHRYPCPLVIVDQGLPGQLQGMDFIEMVHSLWPSTGVVLMSGYMIDPVDLPPSVAYLHKPWHLDELGNAVATVLNQEHTDR